MVLTKNPGLLREFHRRPCMAGIAQTIAIVTLLCGASLSAADSSDPLDDPIESLKPKVARTEAETDRVQAQAEFAAGRMLEQREDVTGALRRYERAARYDPDAVPILRSVVDMGVRLHRNAEATRYALRYAELDSSNVSLLHGLARIVSAEENQKQAIKLYERALATSVKSAPNPEQVEMLLELGRLQYLSKEYEAAATTLFRLNEAIEHPGIFQLSPAVQKDLVSDGTTYQLLAETLLESGKLDEAAAIFAKLEASMPNPADAAWHAARLATKRKKYDDAQAALEKYFATHSAEQGTAPYELLAEVLKAQDKSGDLIPQLTKLRAADPDNALLTFSLAERLKEDGKLDLARPLYWQLVKDKPVVETFRGLMEIERQTKQPQAVLKAIAATTETFKTATVAALGDSAKKLTSDGEQFDAVLAAARAEGDKLDVNAALGLAAVASANEKLDVAKEFFEIALKTAPKDATEWLRYWGVELFSAEKFADASAVFQRGIEAKPTLKQHSELLYLLASSLAFEEKTDLALSAARKAAALDSKSVRLRARIGWIQYHGKRNDDAYKSYKDLVERFGKSEAEEDRDQLREARQVLSNLCVIRGDMPEAIEWLEQVLDEFPDDAGAANDLGYLWADQNKHLQRSLAMIQHAVDVEPDNLAYRDSLGWVYFRLNKLDDAERELRKAVAGEKTDGAVLEHLGDVLVKSTHPEAAADVYRKAIAALEKEDEQGKLESVKKKLADVKP